MNLRSRKAVLVWIVCGFAAGLGCGVWVARAGKEKAAAKAPSGPRPPAALAGETTGGLVFDAGQAKADARLALQSPQAFLDSLRGESGLKAQARIVAAIAEMPLDAVRELSKYVETMGYGGGMNQWQFNWAVFSRWAELDANGLLTEARQSSNYVIRDSGVSAAMMHLARQDAAGAWEKAQDMGGSTFSAKQSVLQAIGETDPAMALQLVMGDDPSRQQSWMVGSFMSNWLVRDQAAALQALGTVPAGEFRSELIRSMGETMAAMDPRAAMDWAKGLQNPAERQNALRQSIDVLARRDPKATLAMLDDPAFAAQRRDGLRAAVAAWSRKDFDGALGYALDAKSPADRQQMLSALSQDANAAQRARLLEVAKDLPASVAKSIYQSALNYSFYSTGIRSDEVLDQVKSTSVREELIKNQLERGWGKSPEELTGLFAKLQPTSQTTQQVNEIAQRLGWSDPAAALKWAGSLGSEDLKNSALQATLRAWANADPKAALEKINLLTNPEQRTQALRDIASAWTRQDEAAARTWAQSLGGAERSAALGALIQHSLQASPENAQALYTQFAASLDAETAAKSENKQVARSVAATLTENDPQEAIAWAASLAHGGAQDEAFSGIAQKWANYDPVATSEWIATLPKGEGRDMAAANLVSVIARDDPDSAWAWATSIQDAAKRRDAAGSVLQAWKGYGKTDAARQQLQQAGFSAEDVKELGKRLE